MLLLCDILVCKEVRVIRKQESPLHDKYFLVIWLA